MIGRSTHEQKKHHVSRHFLTANEIEFLTKKVRMGYTFLWRKAHYSSCSICAIYECPNNSFILFYLNGHLSEGRKWVSHLGILPPVREQNKFTLGQLNPYSAANVNRIWLDTK